MVHVSVPVYHSVGGKCPVFYLGYELFCAILHMFELSHETHGSVVIHTHLLESETAVCMHIPKHVQGSPQNF